VGVATFVGLRPRFGVIGLIGDGGSTLDVCLRRVFVIGGADGGVVGRLEEK
jgi:hypothetical protein